MKIGLYKGFTIIELLIAVLVAAILLALASPSFTTLTMNKRITTQANELVSSLALARSEALKRVERVTVCRSANGTSCAGSGGWHQGWIVFNDRDNDAQVDGGEPIIKAVSALPNGTTLLGTTDVRGYISYVASGHSKLTSGAFQSGSLVLCDSRGPGEHTRVIAVNVTGRVRVEASDADLASCDPLARAPDST